jgi:hypothetical protein
MIFNPSRGEARQFLFDLWDKHVAGATLSALEAMALAVVLRHPEYQPILGDRERYLEREWKPEGGETNPFLHLQMHLAIEEQVSIDQPPGIREAVRSLAGQLDSEHDALHEVMDCLAEMIWNAQRHGAPFDNAAYLDCVARKR